MDLKATWICLALGLAACSDNRGAGSDASAAAPATNPAQATQDDHTAEAADPASAAAPYGYVPEDVVLKNGMSLPLRQTLSAFQTSHPGANCTVVSDQTICEYKQSTTELCYIGTTCWNPAAVFKGEGAPRLNASYSQEDFVKLLDATKSAYGPPKVSQIPPAFGMRVTTYEWRIAEGKLGFMHMMGTDIHGDPIAQPYSVVFTPPNQIADGDAQ